MRKIVYFLFIPLISYGLTLDEAVKKAIDNNLTLKEYKKDVQIKSYQLKEDKQLWFPQFFATYSYTFLKDTPYTSIPSNPPLPSFSFKQFEKQFSNFEMGINYPIFTGFKRINKIKISALDVKSSKYMYSEKINEITAQVKKAYINVLMAKDLVEIYKKQKEAVLQSLKQAQEYHREGLITKIDILQAKVKLSQVERNIKKAEGNLKVAKAYLNSILNQNLEEDIKVSEVKFKIPENLSIKELENLAVKKRSIIKALYQNEKQLDYLYKIEKSSFYPEVFAQGKYSYTNQYPYLDPKGNFSVSVGISLSFQGIKPYYSALKTKKMKEKLTLKIKQIKNNIKLQVKSAFENFLIAKKNLKIAEDTLKQAEEYYYLLKQQYKNQLASMTDLLNAESSYTSARKGKSISYYQLLKAYIDLEKAVGGSLIEE